MPHATPKRGGFGRDRAADVLLLCAFLTGFSALLYEIVWQRVLGLFSGSDVVSATLVVSAYLSGLALGSIAGGHFADRIRRNRLLACYAGLTAGVGFFAIVSTPFFHEFVYPMFATRKLSAGALYLVLFLSLMTPTALMGASFPLLGRLLCGVGSAGAPLLLARLNGINILGAVFGALAAGWYFVGTIGYQKTTYVGAVLDIAAALLALALGPRLTARTPSEVTPPAAAPRGTPHPGGPGTSLPEWAMLTVTSGFIAVSLEIVWLRLLSIYIKSNSYVFAHLMGFLLLGFALGSLLGGRLLARLPRGRLLFLWAQVGVVVYALGSTLLLTWFHPTISRLLGTELFVLDPGQGVAGVLRVFGRFVAVPVALLMPATILIGLTFPCSQKAVQDDPAVVGAGVGFLQAANLLGNISGGLATGLFLLDRIGSFAVLRLLGALGLLFCLYLMASRSVPRRHRVGAAAVSIGLGAMVLAYPDSSRLFARMHNVVPGQPFAVAEDASGIASLVGIPPSYASSMLTVDGLAEGAAPLEVFHSYMGVIAAFSHPNPQSIFVVGIGSGATPFTIGVNPKTRKVTVVELVTAEVKALNQIKNTEAALAFDRILGDPRYDLMVGDARRTLAASSAAYDVIEADAIRPRRAHSGTLYSLEFFALVRSRLRPGGIFVQWQASPRVKATMLNVFPYVVSFDEILIGSETPLRLDRAALLARMSDLHNQAYSFIVGSVRDRFVRVKSVEYWTPADTRQHLDINTDLRPKDEFFLNNDEGTAPMKDGLDWTPDRR